MAELKEFPILGVALLSFGASLTLARIGDEENRWYEVTYAWSAAMWSGGGQLWSSRNED